MLDIKNFTLHFHSAPPEIMAVKGISMHMDKGEIVGLVGESGSGKIKGGRRSEKRGKMPVKRAQKNGCRKNKKSM